MENFIARNQTCGDCGCKEGELHGQSCDTEICPFCSGQLLSCDCRLKIGEEFTNDQWLRILNAKGRIPYINYPHICARCGTFWPKFFMVPDDEWKKYIDPYHRDSILCIDCFNKIKTLIDSTRVKKIDNIDARFMNTVWTNRLVAIQDICSLFKNNGYKPSIIENRKANTVILALCEHGKIANYEYNIVCIDRKGKKKWEWDQSIEYYNMISGNFKREEFCEICDESYDLSEEEKIEEEKRLHRLKIEDDIAKGVQLTNDSWGN